MMRLSRLVPVIFWACASLVASSAWAAGEDPKLPLPEPLRFRLVTDPATLDWNLASTSYETYIIMNLMEGLVEEGPDLKPKPALAERWEVSPDGRIYTFHLREGVKWSDGKPLRAQDFEDSWIRLLDPRTRSVYASFLYDVENAEAFSTGKLKDRAAVGVKAQGPLKLQVKLKQRVPYFLHLATFWVTFPIRSDLVKKHGVQWAMPGRIATLGPYLLKEWKKGAYIRMQKNPAYFARGGTLARAPEEIHAVIEPSDPKARELFEAGKLDVLLNATTQDLLKARSGGSGRARVEQYPYLATYYLAFNVSSGPLKDRQIRNAIAVGLDRDGIPAVLQGGQTVARSWFSPGIDGYSDEGLLKTTLFEARAALTRAGFAEGRGFPKLMLTLARFDGAEQLGRYISKALLERLGITVEFTFPGPGELLRSKPSDLYVAHWGADFPDPENYLSVFLKNSGSNYTGWSSDEYDRLVRKGREASDGAERLLAFAEAEKLLLQKEVVVVPLFYRKNTVLLGSRVKAFQISPLNYLFFKSVTLEP